MRTASLGQVAVFVVCTSVAALVSRSVPEPTLELTATPPKGKAPLTVVLRGVLENIDTEEATYYCLDAEWDFDSDRSLDTNDCPPFESGKQEVQLSYSVLHTFEKPGTYRVRLMLRRGNEILLRGETWVKVASSVQTTGDRWDVPERAEVSDLLRSPGTYNRRTVIVRGRLDAFTTDSSGDPWSPILYVLTDRKTQATVPLHFSGSMDVTPGMFIGQEVEVMGFFRDESFEHIQEQLAASYTRESLYGTKGRIFVEAIDPVDVKARSSDSAKDVKDPDIAPGSYEPLDLRRLLENPEPHCDKRVSVIGKFRGNNLHGDLPFHTKKTPRDFVIKVADAAIWVTGRLPHGKGFRLDANRFRDTGKWLEVIGVPWMDGENVYLRVEIISLTTRPDDPTLEPVAPEKPVVRPMPPEILFTLPLNGERGIPLDTVFQIQFSEDMDPASFDDNILLFYAKRSPLPLEFQLEYDPGSRTLTVTPTTTFVPEAEIRLVLSQGVLSDDGVALAPDFLSRRASQSARGAPRPAAILTFYTGKR